MSFKFGDMVRNDWAGDTNPHKVGMFIYYTTRKSGPFSKTRFAVFAKDGERWEHDASDEKLVVTGNLFDKIAELEKLVSDLIAQAACASEQGARRLAEYLVHESEYPCSSVDDLMTIYRGLK